MILETLKKEWQNTPEYHQHIHELFCYIVNKDEVLNRHRSWVETNIWGFGERSFHYLWKILLSELAENPNILEIGVFRGQTLSLFMLLRPDAVVYGITPLSTEGGMWESDYGDDVRKIHDEFELRQPIILKGLSTDRNIVAAAHERYYDMVYIDGGHTYEVVMNDFLNYAPLVKEGGFLVIDDCNCEMHMPFGYFQGIQDVTNAKIKYMETTDEKWEFVFSVVHISVYRRK